MKAIQNNTPRTEDQNQRHVGDGMIEIMQHEHTLAPKLQHI